jgi:hypothetical protein
MLKLYYKIWADAMVPMSLLMGINLLTFFIWMKKLVNHYLPLYFPVNIFNATLINDFIAIVLTLFVPFLLLNYLLIFTNDRYKDILTRFGSQGGKLYRKYILITFGVFAIPLIIQVMFF